MLMPSRWEVKSELNLYFVQFADDCQRREPAASDSLSLYTHSYVHTYMLLAYIRARQPRNRTRPSRMLFLEAETAVAEAIIE